MDAGGYFPGKRFLSVIFNQGLPIEGEREPPG